jgi:hypothetical protein
VFLFFSFLWAFYLASWVSWGTAVGVIEVEASILGEDLGVKHREPLLYIYRAVLIDKFWR